MKKDCKIQTLGTVATYINGRAFKPSEWETVGLPIVRIQNLTDENAPYHYSSVSHEEKYKIHEGDLLFAWSASLGAHIWKHGDAWLNQHIFRVIPNSEMNKMYLFYYLEKVTAELYQKTHGSGMVHITKGPFMSTPIFVPPLDEQLGIVAKIDEIFSELDKAVDTLKTTKEQLAVYRQAVLNSSFRGLERNYKLRDISQSLSGYAFKSKLYTPAGKYTVVKIGNVKAGYFDFTKDLTRIDEINDKILEKYLLKKGDCLITLTGTRGKRDYGYVSMVEKQVNFLLNQRVAALRFDSQKCYPDFYKYYLSSSEYRNQFFKYETGNVGQGNVGIKALSEPLVPLPPMKKQKEIVCLIEKHLSVCDSIEKTVDTTLAQADAMRQSILKQAFEEKV